MTELLYRGQHYTQHKGVFQKEPVDLIYRRTVYKNRRKASHPTLKPLVYRGNKYYTRKQGLSRLELDNNYLQKELFNLTRQIVNAQFELADENLSNRLWHNVFQKNIDTDRIINLIYSCHSDDDELLRKADYDYLN